MSPTLRTRSMQMGTGWGIAKAREQFQLLLITIMHHVKSIRDTAPGTAHTAHTVQRNALILLSQHQPYVFL